jgi:hypothetical protein
MKVTVDPSGHAQVEFETEEELHSEYRNNISAGGLSLSTDTSLSEFTPIQLTLKLLGRGQITVPAMVVRLFEGAIAVAIEANPEDILTALNSEPVAAVVEAAREKDPEEKDSSPEKEQNTWDRVRNMSRNEKLMLASKADRAERAVLGQDNDAQVLFYLLKNPRITIEEVSRIARSPLLSSITADLIAKTTQWSSNPDIKAALVSNPRTPTPLAIKLLPTLPESEIRQIAKATAVSQALKQAALRIIVNKK